ncbi:hypothetical protein [Telmatospirillum sp. J64-1]|uniref:hypothetical protein n=1 Tax=Telmatospirillum sp. J64-1 TaxID=2502183 RepID=UPI00115D473E|nr:hypothetical protein [Telmatospirillum sp. J64-1]
MPFDILSGSAICDLESLAFPPSIVPASAVGSPSLVQEWVIEASGIASTVVIGAANPAYVVTGAGLAPVSVVGGASALVQIVSAAGIPSAAELGYPNLVQRIHAVGINAGSAVGAPQLTQIISAAGIPTTVVFGSPYVVYSPWNAWQRYCIEGAPGAVYLVELEAFQGDPSSRASDDGASAISGSPISALSEMEESLDGTTMLTWSDMGWIGDPTDPDRPNADYEARAVVPMVMERTIPLYGSARQTVQFGMVELDNGDGGLDGAVRNLSVDGREIRVFLGRRDAVYRDMGLLARGKAVEWYAARDRVRIELRDLALDLNIAAAQQVTYAGTGGLEGGEDLKDKTKPACWGRCFNVPAVLVDPLHEIWQVHWRRIEAVDAVRDRGVPLAGDSDYPDHAALLAANVPKGHYATCKALGLIRLGGSHEGVITADVRGDADDGYSAAIGDIALRFLRAAQGVSPEAIDEDSFADLPSGAAGYFSPAGDVSTADQVLDDLMQGVGAWWGTTRDGLIRCGRLEDPAGAPADFDLDETSILDIDVIPPSQPPIWRQRILYRRNWSPQSDVPDTVDAALRQTYAEDGRMVTAANPDVSLRSLGALDPEPIASLFADEAAARDEAERILKLFGPRRTTLSVTTRALGYTLDLGQVVNVRYSRFGLDDGRRFIVIGTRDEADKSLSTLTLWG